MSVRRPIACAAAALLALTACSQGSTAEHTNLQVMSWWTSSSEKPALQVLLDAYDKADPSVPAQDVSVAGGSGSAVSVVLAQRIAAGDPPDVWQTFTGPSTTGYVSSGRLADVSEAVSPLQKVLPSPVYAGVTSGGKQYGMPVSAHRQNVLLVNTDVLSKAGVAAPSAGYTQARLERDLARVKASGTPALCLGGKDTFTKAELFEDVLLGTVGTAGWQDMARDRYEWGGAQTKSALAAFGRMLDLADPAADGMTWDAAAAKLRSGGCGYLVMNDSAYAEVGAGGSVRAMAYPGTDDAYLAVLDTFVVARQTGHLTDAKTFLRMAVEPSTQLAFAKAKGSVPVRTDVDVSGLSPYQKEAAQAYRSGAVLPSITHGELFSTTFQAGFYDAVAAYAGGRDSAAFVRRLVDTGDPAVAPAR